ncbi:hypothetical protein AURDEDRAFT_132182, partial [Auricularia subglabra TFB-10046 SS5]
MSTRTRSTARAEAEAKAKADAAAKPTTRHTRARADSPLLPALPPAKRPRKSQVAAEPEPEPEPESEPEPEPEPVAKTPARAAVVASKGKGRGGGGKGKPAAKKRGKRTSAQRAQEDAEATAPERLTGVARILEEAADPVAPPAPVQPVQRTPSPQPDLGFEVSPWLDRGRAPSRVDPARARGRSASPHVPGPRSRRSSSRDLVRPPPRSRSSSPVLRASMPEGGAVGSRAPTPAPAPPASAPPAPAAPAPAAPAPAAAAPAAPAPAAPAPAPAPPRVRAHRRKGTTSMNGASRSAGGILRGNQVAHGTHQEVVPVPERPVVDDATLEVSLQVFSSTVTGAERVGVTFKVVPNPSLSDILAGVRQRLPHRDGLLYLWQRDIWQAHGHLQTLTSMSDPFSTWDQEPANNVATACIVIEATQAVPAFSASTTTSSVPSVAAALALPKLVVRPNQDDHHLSYIRAVVGAEADHAKYFKVECTDIVHGYQRYCAITAADKRRLEMRKAKTLPAPYEKLTNMQLICSFFSYSRWAAYKPFEEVEKTLQDTDLYRYLT